ncbi:MAG: trypsin-like peptidase domain-containing protein [Planctomycetota bacterium]|nr:trypsin-like peptidase domain-containing protein [Planctomycetota bacterium]
MLRSRPHDGSTVRFCKQCLAPVFVVAWFACLVNCCYGSSRRVTPTVKAVAENRGAVVNIRGLKSVVDDSTGFEDPTKRVNGMGTGVVVDARGYIITNHHVIDGVRRIQVTLDNGRVYLGRLIARDATTDLAVVKIDCQDELPVIRIGTSRDLMLGEPVIAIGNAYGYPHTVSEGIISALDRTVQVSDTQQYHRLIQTNASINPGNSGGPLLNIDGQMVGINVAVRVGAQGIAFAIPVDVVMTVAGRLMNSQQLSGIRHGIEGETTISGEDSRFVVKRVEPGSPAASTGMQEGDVIRRIGNTDVVRQLDVERAIVGLRKGGELKCHVIRAESPIEVTLVLDESKEESPADRCWRALGLRLRTMSDEQFQRMKSATYRGGMYVVEVNPQSAAGRRGMRAGDVLVGIHRWQTVSMENVEYVLRRGNLGQQGEVEILYLRNQEELVATVPGSQLR